MIPRTTSMFHRVQLVLRTALARAHEASAAVTQILACFLSTGNQAFALNLNDATGLCRSPKGLQLAYANGFAKIRS